MRREVSQSRASVEAKLLNAIFREHFAASRVQLAAKMTINVDEILGGFSVSRPLE